MIVKSVLIFDAHLVVKGQGLSDVSREAIDDDAIGVWDFHDLLLDLGDSGFLPNTDGYR